MTDQQKKCSNTRKPTPTAPQGRRSRQADDPRPCSSLSRPAGQTSTLGCRGLQAGRLGLLKAVVETYDLLKVDIGARQSLVTRHQRREDPVPSINFV